MKRIVNSWKSSDSFVTKFHYIDNLTNEQKDAIAAVLIVQKFYKNQIIVNEGDPGSSFYIIKEVTHYTIIGNCFSTQRQ